jgi:hypothetical protein
MTARYVQRLHERIRLLEEQLSSKRVEEGSETAPSPVRRIPVFQDGNSTPNSRRSTLQIGRMIAPTLEGNGDVESAVSTPNYLSGNIEPLARGILNRSRSDDNTRYEWNEGGDERDSGTDAMGTGFKGNGHSGFFGNSTPKPIIHGRWVLNFVLR